MSEVRRLWENFTAIYTALVEWLETLVGPAEGRAVARRSLAYIARLAWNGYQTQEGPWAELVQLCLADMASHGLLGLNPGIVGVRGPKRQPDDKGLMGICALYAAAYQAAYDGQWDMREREIIYQYMRMHDPVAVPQDQEDVIEAAPLEIRTLLRRACNNNEEWFSPDTLVGTVALAITDDEIIRSLFWARQNLP